MKRLFFSVFALLVLALSVSAQEAAGPKAMKPTIMVVPEKAWCLNKGYVQANNPNAVDYSLALRDDDVLNVVTEMGKIMAERGFPLKLLSSALEALQTEAAMDVALVSKEDGEIVEDDLDKLTRVAGADILVNIAFTRTQRGPRNMIEFRVTSVDAATSKQIGGETGVSSASGAPVTVLLQESVLSFMDNFSAGIQRHFQNIVDNGREGSIIFKIASDCPLNFESEVEYNGDTGELCDLIDYWMSENAVNGSSRKMARRVFVFLTSRFVSLCSVKVSSVVRLVPSMPMDLLSPLVRSCRNLEYLYPRLPVVSEKCMWFWEVNKKRSYETHFYIFNGIIVCAVCNGARC